MKKIFLLIFLFSSLFSHSQHDKAHDIFSKMMKAMDNVQTCSFVVDVNERIKGVMKHDEYVIKLNAKPYKVYVYSIIPNPGAEALLIKGENHEKAVINPNRFPIPTLNLSPYHNLLRRNHQYTICHFGFEYISDILNGYMKKFGETFYSYMYPDADVTWKGKSYYQLVIENKNFGYENYTVKPGENLVKIGEKLIVNDYMILEANPHLKNYDDVKPGQVIKVPNSFGKKIIFYVDKNSFLPMVQIIYDDKGLYGRVEFSSFVLNPVFTKDDFSKENKKYGF
ncbi:MAG: LysM peptidoglycan-binding domain-containing protein [Bacteroidia bacterium]